MIKKGLLKGSTCIILVLCASICTGQINCIKHWSADGKSNKQLDSMLSKIPLTLVDTLYCDSFTVNHPLNHQWYINFYNKQFGNYFSNAKSVNFAMFHFKQKKDSLISEIHTIQFTLSSSQIALLKKKLGSYSEKYKTLVIEAWAAYKHIITGNNIYFITTESGQLIRNGPSFFDAVFKCFTD